MKKLTQAIRLAIYGSSMSVFAAYAAEMAVLDTVEVVTENRNAPSEETGKYTMKESRSATGLPLSIKETPQSVSVMTNQRMKDQNITTLTKALNHTTGVSAVLFDRGRTAYSARGFSIEKYFVDGLPVEVNNQWTTGESTIDSVLYDRVEVVRGSTGLTTGAGDPSAAVSIVRKRATSPSRYTIFDSGINRFGTWSTTIDHTQPLTEDGSVRGRFIADHNGGRTFIDRERIQHNTLYANVEADLSDKTSLGVGVSYQREDKKNAMWGGLPAFYSDGSQTDFAREHNSSANWVRWDSKTFNYFADLTHKFNDRWKLKASVNHKDSDSDSKLFYFSGESVDKTTGLGWDPSPGKFHTDTKQTTVTLDLTGQFEAWGLNHDVNLGLSNSYYQRKSTQADYTLTGGATNFFTWNGDYPEPIWGESSIRNHQSIKEFGAYLATRLRLSEKFSAVLGSRLSRWESEGISYGSSLDYKTKNVFTPYAGLLYDITPNQTVYVSYSDIFKPQSQRDSQNKLLDPVTGESYELGWKGSFFEDNLQTQLSLFQSRQDNLAQPTGSNIPNVSPNTEAYYGAKGAKVKGFETEVTGNATDNWQLTLGYSYWTGKNANGTRINTTQPRKQFKLFTTYRADRLLQGLSFGAGVRWQSRIYLARGNQTQTQKGYAVVDLMAKYQMTDNFSAQLNVENVFDKKYRAQMSGTQYGYGEPLNVTAKFRYEF